MDTEELYRKYAPALLRRSRSLLGDDDALDIVQEAFVRYIRADYQKGSAFALLYRITTNLSIDSLRLRARNLDTYQCIEIENVAVPGDTEQRVHSAMDFAFLTHGLKEKYIEVGVLYHCDGYSQEEIASSLGLSRKSVGKTIQRVQKHIQQRAARVGYRETRVVAS